MDRLYMFLLLTTDSSVTNQYRLANIFKELKEINAFSVHPKSDNIESLDLLLSNVNDILDYNNQVIKFINVLYNFIDNGTTSSEFNIVNILDEISKGKYNYKSLFSNGNLLDDINRDFYNGIANFNTYLNSNERNQAISMFLNDLYGYNILPNELTKEEVEKRLDFKERLPKMSTSFLLDKIVNYKSYISCYINKYMMSIDALSKSILNGTNKPWLFKYEGNLELDKNLRELTFNFGLFLESLSKDIDVITRLSILLRKTFVFFNKHLFENEEDK